MIHLVTAFDPGVTTGIAVRYGDGTLYTRAETDIEVTWKFVLLSKKVVYENFATAGVISTYGLHTVRVIGGIMALCAEHKIPIYKHQPQQRRAFQLPAHTLLKGTKHMIHEEDALAHLLAFEKLGK